MSETIAILLLTVCAPLWIIFHYITKMRTSKGLTPEDEKMLTEVWESTKRMEDRIQTQLLQNTTCEKPCAPDPPGAVDQNRAPRSE